MRDPYPKFIPLWTKAIKLLLKGTNHLDLGDVGEIYLKDIRLDWMQHDRCFVGEALRFNKKDSLDFGDSDNQNLMFESSMFDSLDEFYTYKKQLYTAIQRFNHEKA